MSTSGTGLPKHRLERIRPQTKEQPVSTHSRYWKGGPRMRVLVSLPALVVAVGLAFTGSASAQTTLQADVSANGPGQAFCANGAYLCGTANIAGYGTASWDLFVLGTGYVYSPCGTTYEAQTDFTLTSDPSSTLVVNESGNLCGLGHDGAAYRGYFANGAKAAGHPFAVIGSWAASTDCSTVLVPGAPACSTGQFQGLAGSGTDVMNIAGLHASGSYSGTLG